MNNVNLLTDQNVSHHRKSTKDSDEYHLIVEGTQRNIVDLKSKKALAYEFDYMPYMSE